jgi:hypothetical protein
MRISSQNKIFIAALGGGFLLAACGSDTPAPLPADTLGMRATAQIETGVRADKITVIPNTTAGWTSQILLLANGQVSRTRVDGGKAQAVNAGDVKDIIGLKRESAAGVVLTLTPDGTLRALIEKDDEGRLGRMNVDTKATNYSGFCQYSQAPMDALMVMAKNDLVTLGVSYEGNDVITLREVTRETYAAPITACFVKDKDVFTLSRGSLALNGADILSADAHGSFGVITAGKNNIVLTVQNQHLIRTRLAAPKFAMKVAIEDGLSIGGTDRVSAVYTTTENLGGTFNKGMIAVQDGNSNRLVLIANDYAASTLDQQTPKR